MNTSGNDRPALLPRLVGPRRYKLKMETLKRHPAAVELDNWIESAEGKGCTEPTTLNAPAMQRQYLKNRLQLAFNAGWCAAEKHVRVKRHGSASFIERVQAALFDRAWMFHLGSRAVRVECWPTGQHWGIQDRRGMWIRKFTLTPFLHIYAKHNDQAHPTAAGGTDGAQPKESNET